MTSMRKENLEERIERMRKRNEEIEKKYREAEEDRLRALQNNAMIDIKQQKTYEDWPKAHKYDKIDFTYDIKPEKLEEFKKDDANNKKLNKRNDHYKKFPDGEGPPPDPAYNFLADAERDGITNTSHKNSNNTNLNNNNKKDLRSNINNKSHQQLSSSQQQQYKRGAVNNSFRNYRNNISNSGNDGSNKAQKNFKQHHHKQSSQIEYDKWRNDREKIDEVRIGRQKISDSKWKREWDNDKMNAAVTPVTNNEIESCHFNTVANPIKKSPTHVENNSNASYGNSGGITLKLNRQNSSGLNFVNATDCLIEKRGNITVSVSQTGEVKSVKLTSAPAIGTGRVGPRQIIKPQFSIQTIENDVTIAQPLLSHHPQMNSVPVKNNIAIDNIVRNDLLSNMPQNTMNENPIEIPLVSPDTIKIKRDNSQHHINYQLNNPVSLIAASSNPSVTNTIESIILSTNNIMPIMDQQHQNIIPAKILHEIKPSDLMQQAIQKEQQLLQKHKQQQLQKPSNQATGQQKLLKTVTINDALPKAIPILKKLSSPPPSTAAAAAALASSVPSVEQESFSANDVPPIPIVDLSHKPEFAKKSIQDRLLRVRKANSNTSSSNSNDKNDNVSQSIVSNNSNNINKETRMIKKSIENNENLTKICDNSITNESIPEQSVEASIIACN